MLSMLFVVEGPDLRLTVLVVSSAVGCAAGAPVADNKSDRIKPVEPLCLTLDHPFD